MLWSLLKITHLSPNLKPVVGAGAGLPRLLWIHDRTVSHPPVSVNTDVGTGLSFDVHLDVSLSVSAEFGFGSCFNLNSLPSCGCCNSSGLFNPPVCIISTCMEVCKPTPVSVNLGFLSRTPFCFTYHSCNLVHNVLSLQLVLAMGSNSRVRSKSSLI